MTTIWRRFRVTGWSWLLAGLSVSSFAQQGKLLVKTVLCEKITTARPIPVHVSVFEAEKVPEIASLSKEIETSPSCVSANTVDRCLELYKKMRKLALATPALARVESLPGPEYEITLPPVREVIVFAFDKNNAEPTAYVQQLIVMSSDEVNEVVLDFSSEGRCKAEP